jgi:hypothetical protein
MAMSVSSMSAADKVTEAMQRSLSKLPGDVASALQALFSPANLAIMAGGIVVWVGSHAFGIGEIVDILLLGVGVFALGWSVFSGAEKLLDFAAAAVNATSESDLDTAAGYFAEAVTILGVAAIQAFLLRGQVRQAEPVLVNRGPTIKPRLDVGTPPPPGNDLRLSRPFSLPSPRGTIRRGTTDAYGRMKVASGQPIAKQREVLYHELVHRFFAPKVGPLRRLRAELRIGAYQRVALMRYLEETLAQGISQFRINGLLEGFRAYRFPIDNGYVTVSKMAGEGSMLGTIMLAGTRFYISFSTASIPTDEVEFDSKIIGEKQDTNDYWSAALLSVP